MSKDPKNKIAEKSSEKKAMILDSKKKNRLPLLIVPVFVVALIAAAFSFYGGTSKNEGGTIAAYTTKADPAATTVSYPLEQFADGQAKHYSYQADDGINIAYFIIKSSDGVIRAAFDACDVCWPAGQGYKQSGDAMVCRNCGRQFVSVLVNEVSGGCNPAPLNRKVADGKVVLQIKDILAGKQYFNFS